MTYVDVSDEEKLEILSKILDKELDSFKLFSDKINSLISDGLIEVIVDSVGLTGKGYAELEILEDRKATAEIAVEGEHNKLVTYYNTNIRNGNVAMAEAARSIAKEVFGIDIPANLEI